MVSTLHLPRAPTGLPLQVYKALRHGAQPVAVKVLAVGSASRLHATGCAFKGLHPLLSKCMDSKHTCKLLSRHKSMDEA
jgi:hypothetical protein